MAVNPLESGLNVDLYQLTSLVPHFDAGRLDQQMTMSFFVRSLPPNREYLVWCGLRRIMDFLFGVGVTETNVQHLMIHPVLGASLKTRPKLVDRFRRWKFDGEIWALPEGHLVFSNKSSKPDEVNFPMAYMPFMEITASLFTLKMIETPLLSIMNQMTGVATATMRMVQAASGRPIIEGGQRRTGKDSSSDASYAAYVGGASSTSNVRAFVNYGVPCGGTMDHFAVLACQLPGVSREKAEAQFFREFQKAYPDNIALLVDTFDTFGERTGIRNAVMQVGAENLKGIRIDSGVSPETMLAARQLLDSLGANQTKIIVSGGLTVEKILELKDSPVDGFIVGENISCVADSPVTGATAKICAIGPHPVMKVARGTGKGTLPGPIAIKASEGTNFSLHLRTSSTGATGNLMVPVYQNGVFDNTCCEIQSAQKRALSQLDELVPYMPEVVFGTDMAWQIIKLQKGDE
jgi:nicotinate phosphoribosyltransferase